MTPDYPTRFSDVSDWSKSHRVALAEGRIRFAQYAVLRASAGERSLRDALVFKGGNVLDFVWFANRSTIDLDFSLDSHSVNFNADETSIRANLEQGLRRIRGPLAIECAVYSVRQNPRGAERTFAAFQARVGYALPDEDRLRLRMLQGGQSPHVVQAEISQNEPICAAELVAIDESHQLRVSTLEDIVAEKLRALLQQPIRRRNRRQDLLDVAAIVRRQTTRLDRVRVGS